MQASLALRLRELAPSLGRRMMSRTAGDLGVVDLYRPDSFRSLQSRMRSMKDRFFLQFTGKPKMDDLFKMFVTVSKSFAEGNETSLRRNVVPRTFEQMKADIKKISSKRQIIWRSREMGRHKIVQTRRILGSAGATFQITARFTHRYSVIYRDELGNLIKRMDCASLIEDFVVFERRPGPDSKFLYLAKLDYQAKEDKPSDMDKLALT